MIYIEIQNLVKSPLNYTGGKYKLLPQILPLFPQKINTFVDLFCGGCNVGINVQANKIIFNDINSYLIDLFREFKRRDLQEILRHIEERICEYKLTKHNEEGFKNLRKYYNNTKLPLDLYVLVCYSFNYQIRFNNKHQYNSSFGKNRSEFSVVLKEKLIKFIKVLHTKNVDFYSADFCEFDYSNLSDNDLVYCDPPYLIATASYNDGKRGFKGWSKREEIELLKILDELDKKNIRFALSNVLEHKGQVNEILVKWSQKYKIHYLNYDYSNCSYHKKNKNKSVEVLIVNY